MKYALHFNAASFCRPAMAAICLSFGLSGCGDGKASQMSDAAAAAAATNGHSTTGQPAARPPEPPTEVVNGEGEGSRSGGTDEMDAQPAGETSSVDMSPTSWQNPFRAEYWDSAGWEFGDAGMSSTNGDAATATFRRDYRKLMLDLDLQQLAQPASLTIRMDAESTGWVVDVTVSGGRVQVLQSHGKEPAKLIREAELKPPLDAETMGKFRVVATGNRLQAIWNGRRLLTCDQPAGQSGRDLTLSIVSPTSGFRITRLRVEGE